MIIDTPPVLAASDALVLASRADAVLICTMRDRSRAEQVQMVHEPLEVRGRPSDRRRAQRRADEELCLPLWLLLRGAVSQENGKLRRRRCSTRAVPAPGVCRILCKTLAP